MLFLHSLDVMAADPTLQWKTHESEHFLIHYPQSLKHFVAKVDVFSQQSHESLSAYFKWQPKHKTHLVLSDEVDQANGFAMPIPNNAMTLYMQPPTQGELLVYDDWLKMLIQHEYTHILHIDKVLNTPAFLRSIFGRFILLFPNALHPNWFQEGLATYMETDDSTGVGRGQSDTFQMMMRQEVLAGIKPLSRINTVSAHDWPFNSAYLYGVYFFRFIKDVYGEQSIMQLVDNYSENVLPYRVNSNPWRVTGKTLEQLWPDFRAYLNGYFKPQIERIKQQKSSDLKSLSASHLAYGTLAKGLNGDLWYSAISASRGAQLYVYSENTAKEHNVLELNSLATLDVSNEGKVLISQLEHCGQYAQYYDLYVLDNNKLQSITECGRYRLAKWLSKDRILALRYESGLAMLQVLDDQGVLLETIWRGDSADIISTFDVNKSGDVVAAMKFGLKPWNLYLWRDQKWVALTDDALVQSQPYFYGDDVYFVQGQIGQFEAYKIDLSNKLKTRLSHNLGGIKQVLPISGDEGIALAYSHKGYQVTRLNLKKYSNLYEKPQEKHSALPSFNISLKEDKDYTPFPSLLPSYWFPVLLSQGDLQEVGFFTSGNDALLNHQYLAQLTYERETKRSLVNVNYIYDSRLIVGLQQSLINTQFDAVSEYNEQLFAAYMQPILQMQNSFFPYLAYINSRTEFILNQSNSSVGSDINDNWFALGLIYDGLRTSLNAGDASDGWQASFSFESADIADSSLNDAEVLNLNTRYYLTMDTGHTIAQRLFLGVGLESGSPFQLGGEKSDAYIGPGIQLKQRSYALRGFDDDLLELRGDNSFLYNIEYRLPFSWKDHNIMVPPVGF